MLPLLLDLLWQSLLQTLAMTFAAGAISFVVGLPLAILLVTTDRQGIRPIPALSHMASWIVNPVRSVPFIILLIILIPVTRLIAGTSLGPEAAISPLTVSIQCLPQ
jgi:D-methionine transport system permease protein